MLCDICHQNEATVVYTVVVEGKKTTLHLCEECAKRKGLIKPKDLLNVKDLISFVSRHSDEDAEKIKCSNCGLSYKEFKETTQFGCPICYTAFRNEIIPLLKRIHGSTQHIGKGIIIQKDKEVMEVKIFELKKKLKKAIEEEKYEEAAKIRDELKKYDR